MQKIMYLAWIALVSVQSHATTPAVPQKTVCCIKLSYTAKNNTKIIRCFYIGSEYAYKQGKNQQLRALYGKVWHTITFWDGNEWSLNNERALSYTAQEIKDFKTSQVKSVASLQPMSEIDYGRMQATWTKDGTIVIQDGKIKRITQDAYFAQPPDSDVPTPHAEIQQASMSFLPFMLPATFVALAYLFRSGNKQLKQAKQKTL